MYQKIIPSDHKFDAFFDVVLSEIKTLHTESSKEIQIKKPKNNSPIVKMHYNKGHYFGYNACYKTDIE